MAAGLLAPAVATSAPEPPPPPTPATAAPVDTVVRAAPPDAPAPQPRRSGRRRPRVRRVTPSLDALEKLPIRRVDVAPRDVFDPIPPTRLAPLLRTANKLHIRTRASTVRRELLFDAGEPWSARVAQETARRLRALDYLDPRLIEARPESGGVAVRVETRDLWTTAADVNVESGGGRRVGSAGVTERNLLGLGKTLAASYRDDGVTVSRNLVLEDPNVAGTKHRMRYGAGKGSDGASNRVEGGLPFVAETSPFAWQLGWDRTTFVGRLYAHASEAAAFDERLERVVAWAGFGQRADGTVLRTLGSFEYEDRRRGPTRLEPFAPPAFDGGEENVRRRLIAAELQIWQPRFVELEDINRMDRIEDFDVGLDVRLRGGWSPGFLGATADEGYASLRVDRGTTNALGVGWVESSVTSWLHPNPRDLVTRIDARWFLLPAGHTIAFAVHGVAGANVSRDFQVSVGGLNGLRAYPTNAVAGHRLWRLNAEDRWIFSPEAWTFLKLGTAAFYDAARGWGPGAEGTGWFHDAGVGLRLALPQAGVSQVFRLDVAWPLSPSRDGRHEPVLSFGSSQAF